MSKRRPPTGKPIGKGGGRSPPPFSIGFPVGGDRLGPQNRRFQDRSLKNKELRTSGTTPPDAASTPIVATTQFRTRPGRADACGTLAWSSASDSPKIWSRSGFRFVLYKGIPKWFWGQVVFGGLACQGQNHICFRQEWLFGLAAEGGRAKKPSISSGAWGRASILHDVPYGKAADTETL